MAGRILGVDHDILGLQIVEGPVRFVHKLHDGDELDRNLQHVDCFFHALQAFQIVFKSDFIFGHNIVAKTFGFFVAPPKISHDKRAVVNEFGHGVNVLVVFLLVGFCGMPLLSDVVYFLDGVDFSPEHLLLF